MAIKKPGKGSSATPQSKRSSSKPSMAIDKANTPTWMKATLILLAIVFASSFVTIGAGSCSQTFNTTPVETDPVKLAESRYQGSVDALNGLLQSEPESYTVLVNLGDIYFDWARQLSSSAQTSTAAAQGAYEKWIAASETYGRALKESTGTSPVRIDYAFALFNSNQTTEAINVAEDAVKADPKFAMAPFALAEFLAYRGDTQTALKNYQQYLKLDPKNEWGNKDYVDGKIKELGSSSK